MGRKIEPNEDGVRIAPLGALDDFEVAQGYPDVRGWKVMSSDGRDVGQVHELLIDVDNLRTRYLDVRLSNEIAATPGERDVLVPIGTANIVEDQKAVRVPLTATALLFGPKEFFSLPTPCIARSMPSRRRQVCRSSTSGR